MRSRQESLPAGRYNRHPPFSLFGEITVLMKVVLEGIELHLAHPDELNVTWVGQDEAMRQLMAAWMVLNDRDFPMNPRLLGKPGVGKTTMAYAAGKRLGREVYIVQATVDTRPEDLRHHRTLWWRARRLLEVCCLTARDRHDPRRRRRSR